MSAPATPPTAALSGSEIQAALRNYGLTDAKIKYELQATGLTPAGLLERIVDAQTSLAHYQANRRVLRTTWRPGLEDGPAPSVPSTAVAPAPVSAPSRPAWTSAQMDERVQRIVQSQWAQGRGALAAQLCASSSSIEEAIGVLKVSAGVTASTAADEETVESVAARIVAAGKRTSAARSGDSGTLSASEIYARRRHQGRAF